MPAKKYLKVDVAGRSHDLWKGVRHKLTEAINSFLDATIDAKNNTTVRDEAKQFTTAMLKHAKEKLARAGYENDKLIAEIDNLYALREKEMAESRKLNAEAAEIELEVSIKRLKLSLGMSKALLIGEKKKADIVFVKQIDAFIEVLKEFEGPK